MTPFTDIVLAVTSICTLLVSEDELLQSVGNATMKEMVSYHGEKTLGAFLDLVCDGPKQHPDVKELEQDSVVEKWQKRLIEMSTPWACQLSSTSSLALCSMTVSRMIASPESTILINCCRTLCSDYLGQHFTPLLSQLLLHMEVWPLCHECIFSSHPYIDPTGIDGRINR